MNKFYTTFYGEKISDYGLESGFVDYRALANCFDHILNNEIVSKVDDFYLCSGAEFYETEDGEIEYLDIYQFYIISAAGAGLLMRETSEIVYYSESYDIYLWGVTHYGTSWDYVLTEIPCREKE